MKKKVIITGVTGQDGSYLAELLLSKNYEVYCFVRRETFEKIYEGKSNISHIKEQIHLKPVSITDPLDLFIAISEIMPDEFYHLAAYSYVSYDMTDELNIFNVNFNSTLYILTALKRLTPKCKLFFAGSSEMFGNPSVAPQNETTYFNPKSIYGIAKTASYHLLKNTREKDNFYVSTGFMYNHESERRGSQFVTKKIISTAVKIKLGLASTLELGNLEAQRDWGYAPDYVDAMWLVLQQSQPEDFVIATGQLHTVKDFVKEVFTHLQLDYTQYVTSKVEFYRPSEQIPLVGDASKIKKIGWETTKTFSSMIHRLVLAELSKYN